MIGINVKRNRPGASKVSKTLVLAALIMFSAAAIGRVCLAQPPNQKTFDTAQKATHALFVAIRDNDKPALSTILGVQSGAVCSDSQDQDKQERTRFILKYQEMRRLVQESNGKTVLYIGAENWPFPFPLVSSKGIWRFDTAVGQQEMRFRLIGENETLAIQTCQSLIQLDNSADTGVGKSPKLIHGYYFRSVMPHSPSYARQSVGAPTSTTSRSMPAVLAYPADYRTSGVMTFIIERDGIVHAKDLGSMAGKKDRDFSKLRPDSTWVVEK